MRTLACAYASRYINEVTSCAVADCIVESGIKTSDLVSVNCTGGGISTVSVDTVRLNLLLSGISSLITARLSESEQTFSVPAGNLFSSTLLAGKGPDVTVRLLFAGGISCGCDSTLSSAGINQTLHRVTLRFTVSLTAAVGARDFGFETTSENVVCETVIAGSVPNVYLCGSTN